MFFLCFCVFCFFWVGGFYGFLLYNSYGFPIPSSRDILLGLGTSGGSLSGLMFGLTFFSGFQRDVFWRSRT